MCKNNLTPVSKPGTMVVDGREVQIAGERNLLEVIRKAKINIPTFCYHSELSSYGACRLCMVEVEGRGLMASCSVNPESGMKVRTQSAQIREIRKMSLELVLASHDQSCPTCDRSDSCKLRELASQMGIDKVRFKPRETKMPLDKSSWSLVRDANKCVLCGDCVRYCQEVQGVGAIDFAHRGSNVTVGPAYSHGLGNVECVNCGQCAAVCPTGALSVKSEIDVIQKDLDNKDKYVVVQVAPAVRVALGELFDMAPGSVVTGQMVAALKLLGFKQVFDTTFAADLTVIEEATEFVERKKKGENLPLFTSCCPAWVKYVEQYQPKLLKNLSSCRSPQQMFGSLLKDQLSKELKISPAQVTVVSLMPCTAKKFEAKREEFMKNSVPDVDHVITTQELARMIKQAGIRFEELEAESFDMPFGIGSGAGVIFGNTGGVAEAVSRFVEDKKAGIRLRGDSAVRVSQFGGDSGFKVAVVHGLANAKKLAQDAADGKCEYDLIEVMSCPGGCIAGAGQPVIHDHGVKNKRASSIYRIDGESPLQEPGQNHWLQEFYKDRLNGAGSHVAHDLLHTHYHSRKRIEQEAIPLVESDHATCDVSVCMGTSCFLRGAQNLLSSIVKTVEGTDLNGRVKVSATFCSEQCSKGPTVNVNGNKIHRADLEQVLSAIRQTSIQKREGEANVHG